MELEKTKKRGGDRGEKGKKKKRWDTAKEGLQTNAFGDSDMRSCSNSTF